jgi:hypothetical protein
MSMAFSSKLQFIARGHALPHAHVQDQDVAQPISRKIRSISLSRAAQGSIRRSFRISRRRK